MTHLTDEQFEGALAGSADTAEHLAACDACRARLESMRAMRSRMQAAFKTVSPPPALLAKIRSQTVEAKPVSSKRVLRLMRVVPLAAAACALIVLGIMVYNDPDEATAAQPELARIHNKHLAGPAGTETMYTSDDPKALAAFLKSKLGDAPVLADTGDSAKVTCCCVDRFRGRPVGSYILHTPDGIISVVLLTDPIESLKLSHTLRRDGRSYKACKSGNCNIVAAAKGKYTYCVVGQADHDVLLDVLVQILAGAQQSTGPRDSTEHAADPKTHCNCTPVCTCSMSI